MDSIRGQQRYRNIVNDSNVAASKLSAMIDVYLALQGNTDEVAESDMATELSTLLTQLECYKFDPSNLCAKLKDDIEASLNHTGDEGYTGSPQLTDAGDHAQVDVLTAQSPRQVTSSFFAMLSRCLWSMWSFVSYRLSALSPPATEQRLTNGRVLTHTEATAVRRFKHMGERREVVAVRAAQSSDAACKMTVEGLIKSMRDHTRVLEAQVSKFNVFFEIAQHLKNEVGAYLLAFEAVKTYPTPEKRRALSNMHARVASSSASWKECATALKDGYSRVQK
ncbi:hypothetical protein BD414DRAFT_173942 [Trametes punicea]|nr:hypothetical protein BD414DRAFT_173942 [Trametes punicea]